MPQAELYGKLAAYYDYIYHWKDYKTEVRQIKKLISEYKRSSGNSLLDVACGTGRHISYLRRDFECEGIDVSRDIIAVAKKNVPGIRFVIANMTDFDLGKRFDVVLCLFSSVGYLLTERDIQKASSNFARHLKRGGVLIVEPWFGKSEWSDKAIHMQTYDSDWLKIARISFSRSEEGFSLVDEEFLVGERGKGVTHVKDHHRMRFFEPRTFIGAMTEAGLEATFLKDGLMPGRGLLVGAKPK
jgi:ubiquinone/menaquinone biosynthesis C-methylase UbiE